MSADFEKVVRIGTVDHGQGRKRSTFCTIKFIDGKLSISGVEGPMHNGNCVGACGQINMHEWEIIDYAPGWDLEKVKQFREVWHKWHLNDAQAGSPAQTAALETPEGQADYKAYTETKERWQADRSPSHYSWACAYLAKLGLHPDATGYKYGSKWLRVEVSETALAFLRALPDTDMQPAWV